MSANLTSLLLTPLLIHRLRRMKTAERRKETSRQSRRTIVIEGDLCSFRAKNEASSLKRTIPRDKGLRTSDHIPRSSMSHCSDSRALDCPCPESHDELPGGIGGPRLDFESERERVSKVSRRSVIAASWI